jgi:peptidoglycan glycosyltransferase
LNMRDALAKSSNIYFARLGVEVGGDRLMDAVMKFGVNRSWVVFEGSSGKIASAPGRFPALTNKDTAKTAQISIGQGEMLVTPLHMALIAAAIGRSGAIWEPRIHAGAPNKPADPVMSPDTARTLAGMMRHSVTAGTGRGANIEGLSVAGKTGTAQNPHGADHAWFIGFAPAMNPRLAFSVIVEQGGYGSVSAVPVAAGLLKKAQSLGMFTEATAAQTGGMP